ncbi:MAG: 6-phosphogluconolactonase [Pseudomonadota bacterium]
MVTEPKFHEYETREQLAEALASGVAAVLAGGIATRGHALLAVSGGSTPKLFFDHLSKAEIDWSKVMIILVDERLVPQDHPRSNSLLVRDHLIKQHAAAARFVPYVVDGDTPEECAEASELAFDIAGHRIDAAIFGMGTDGHTASWFPGASNLDQLTDPENTLEVSSTHAPSQGEDRLTLTLAKLLQSRFLALHIEGTEKKSALNVALKLADPQLYPVAALFSHDPPLIDVFWAE